MKKYILFITVALASSLAMAQFNPCEFTIIGGGGSGVSAIDSSTFGDLAPRCPPCPSEGCVGWQIDSQDSCFHIGVYPTHASQLSVQIINNCNGLLWDTCAYVLGGSISPPEMLFFGITVTPNSQILVCGDLGDTIGITVKSLNPAIYPYYGTPVINLDTCSTPLSVTPREPSAGEYYFVDYKTLQVVRDLKPSSTYLKRKKFQQ